MDTTIKNIQEINESASDKNVETEEKKLIEVLGSLEKEIKKQTSLKFTLVKGAVYGLGTVIGATILIALLGWFFSTTIGTFFNTEPVEQYLETPAQL